MKRFWLQAQVVPCGAEFFVALDGKPLKLWGEAPLHLPFAALGLAIAQEWEAAGEAFALDELPLTRLAATAQGRVRQRRGEIISHLASYGMNDLLCYRSIDPPGLVEQENILWDPWLVWAGQVLGVELKTSHGITPLEQPMGTLAAFKAALNRMDEYRLAGMGVIVPALGSLVLGLALQARTLTPEAAFEAGNLGERWQEARWGADEEAVAKRKAILADIAASARFMALCEV
jgi:chaperone required for assembly of F1-ATPase